MIRKSIIVLAIAGSFLLSGCVLGRVSVQGGGCAIDAGVQQTGDGQQYWQLGVEGDGVNVDVGGKVE